MAPCGQLLFPESSLSGRRVRLPFIAGRGLDVAKDWWVGAFILGLIIVAMSCFLSTVPFHSSLTLYYGDVFAVVYFWFVLLLCFLCLFFLLVTVLCDPGIVFPQEGWEAACRHMPSLSSPHAGRVPHPLQSDPTMIPMIHEMEKSFDEALDVHFCKVCQLFVERYDHHCCVIGACIGRRNMWSFILFCTCVAFMCGLCVPASVLFLGKNVIVPTSIPRSFHEVIILFERDLVKVLIHLSAAIYGGGYCFMLALLYCGYVARDMHSVTKRHRKSCSAGPLMNDIGAVDSSSVSLSRRKDFRCCPSASGDVQWRAVRDTFREYSRMELTDRVLARESLFLRSQEGQSRL